MKQQLFVRERAHSKYRAYLLYVVEEGGEFSSFCKNRFWQYICDNTSINVIVYLASLKLSYSGFENHFKKNVNVSTVSSSYTLKLTQLHLT